ncbi:outer membrane porin protein [Caballeronia temeraria]|uniref:Outer membrane porin protein n=1 Tax=Caballeronia temeraria TaxID=1777137 RepID=A0A158AT81_9BURK|nr:outer membrane porin protein [Caballeronia temeraria]
MIHARVSSSALACRMVQSAGRRAIDGTSFGLATSYDEQRGGTNAAANFFDGVTPLHITSSGDKDARLQANGYVNVMGVKLGGRWIGRRVSSDAADGTSCHLPSTWSSIA